MGNNQKNEKRTLNLFDIFNLGFGGAVGSGIFVLMGLGIEATGNSIVLAIIVGCLVMLLAYFYNVLLSSMFCFEGGDYSQKAISFNPFFTGLNGYITFINGFSIAMYSIAMVQYASIIFPNMLLYKTIIALVIITLFFAATIKGSKFISTINSIMTVVLMGAIFIFILFGLPKTQPGFFSDTQFFKNGTNGFITAIALMGWACQGTTMGPVSVSAVTKDPKKKIPQGILMITVALAIVYGLMSYVAAGILPFEKVAGQNLSIVASEIFPRWIFVIFIIGGAVFAIGTSMITGVTMVRYPILKVATDGWLPKFAAKTTNSGYPWVVYLVYYILSITPVLLGFSLGAIVSLVMIPIMIMNVYCNLACINIITKHPKQWEESILHMPKLIINAICIASAICAGGICYRLFITLKPMEMIIAIGILAVCSFLSIFSLKTGRVSAKELERNKEFIIKKSLDLEY